MVRSPTSESVFSSGENTFMCLRTEILSNGNPSCAEKWEIGTVRFTPFTQYSIPGELNANLSAQNPPFKTSPRHHSPRLLASSEETLVRRDFFCAQEKHHFGNPPIGNPRHQSNIHSKSAEAK